MKTIHLLFYIIVASLLLASCGGNDLSESPSSPLNYFRKGSGNHSLNEIPADSTPVKVRPGSVLLTGHPQFRLTPLYEVNYHPDDSTTFIGTTHFYQSYQETEPDNGNRWHGHFMPGLEAVYGDDLVNVVHYDTKSRTGKNLFPKPVVVKTLYYPAFSSDTLNGQPIRRNYFLASVYDQDTNRDALINNNDLRHFYHFDLQGTRQTLLVPANYSVIRSQYDPGNDFMYVYARLDENANGVIEDEEPIHVFLIDLKSPGVGARVY